MIATVTTRDGVEYSAAAYEWYKQIIDGIDYRHGVIPSSCPVPEWLQDAVEGLVQQPDVVDGLTWARITGPVNWPAIASIYSDELAVVGSAGGYDPGWAQVVTVFDYLASQGWVPSLDVDLDVAADGGGLELRYWGILVEGLPSAETVLAVNEIFGFACPIVWPHSALTRWWASGPYRPSFAACQATYPTKWLWTVLTEEDVAGTLLLDERSCSCWLCVALELAAGQTPRRPLAFHPQMLLDLADFAPEAACALLRLACNHLRCPEDVAELRDIIEHWSPGCTHGDQHIVAAAQARVPLEETAGTEMVVATCKDCLQAVYSVSSDSRESSPQWAEIWPNPVERSN